MEWTVAEEVRSSLRPYPMVTRWDSLKPGVQGCNPGIWSGQTAEWNNTQYIHTGSTWLTRHTIYNLVQSALSSLPCIRIHTHGTFPYFALLHVYVCMLTSTMRDNPVAFLVYTYIHIWGIGGGGCWFSSEGKIHTLIALRSEQSKAWWSSSLCLHCALGHCLAVWLNSSN